VSPGTEAVVFNAVPLLLVAVAYATVAGAVLPPLWGERRRSHALDWATALVFPGFAVATGIMGATVLYDRRAIGGDVWPPFVAAIVALLPALLLIARWSERTFVVGGAGRAREAQQRVSDLDREVGALTEISPALARAREPIDVCRPLVRRVAELMDVGFAAVAVISEDDREAVGVYGERDGERAEWWEAVRVDLRDEPSGIASAVFDAAPVTVYDIAGSPLISNRLAKAAGAQSGAWVPMFAEERVIGVLALASTMDKRAFTRDELTLLQAIAAEAGIALERLRAATALASAIERERFVAELTRHVHGETDPARVVEVGAQELRDALGVEIAIDETGAVQVAGDQELTSVEQFLVTTVEREVRSALQTARLLEENRRRLAQQRALVDAAQVVTSELDVETVLQRLVVEVTKLLETDAADCYLLDAGRGVLRCAAVHGLAPEVVGFEFAATRGLAGEALRTGAPVVGDDYEAVAASVPHPAYAEFTSALVAPMAWSGETWGVLGVGLKDRTRRLGPAEVELLEAFASLASLALRNAESFAERSQQARVERGFYRIASLLGEPLSLAETYDAAAQAAAETLGADYAAVLVDERVAGGHGLPREVASLQTPDVLLEASGTVLAAAELASDERFPESWRSAPCASLLAIRVGSDPAAVVVVFFAQSRTFSHDDLELAQHLAGAARGAVDRARMFESERSARSLSQHLARTGSLLATELDPDAVTASVVEEAAALLGADAATLLTLEAGDLVVAAAVGADEAIGARAPATGLAGGGVVQSREPVAHDDVSRDASVAEGDPVLVAGHAGFLGVPLFGGFEDPLRGVLAVYSRDPRRWRDEEVQALTALAANASAALANAELYHRVALEREQSVAILANIAEGVVAVDRDGHVVLWNAAAEEITGVPASEALGRTPAQVLQRDLESETGGTNRLVAIPRGGKDVWLSLSEAVMRDPSGAVAGRIFAFRDISAEHGVEQMKSDFVSTVSVELRTPLTSIYGFAQTLLRGDIAFTDEERRTFLDFIARESERLTEIVDALLDVAALDTGDLSVALAPTDVGAVVRDVIGAAERANMNGHRFVAQVGGEELAAAADADKLRQVLDQLLSNAVKYSPAGGTVTVAARRRGEAVEVSVADEGVGIPAGERERIFSKFYKAGDGQARGTGLGLFIAQGLVREMGGHMWVDSEEGRGSRFTFELPLAHG